MLSRQTEITNKNFQLSGNKIGLSNLKPFGVIVGSTGQGKTVCALSLIEQELKKGGHCVYLTSRVGELGPWSDLGSAFLFKLKEDYPDQLTIFDFESNESLDDLILKDDSLVVIDESYSLPSIEKMYGLITRSLEKNGRIVFTVFSYDEFNTWDPLLNISSNLGMIIEGRMCEHLFFQHSDNDLFSLSKKYRDKIKVLKNSHADFYLTDLSSISTIIRIENPETNTNI